MTEKQRDAFYDVMAAVNDECKTIRPPQGLFWGQNPEYAWLNELLTYASFLAKADGKISKDEVRALTDLLGAGAARINKSTMKLMAFSVNDADINDMPYALPELIARDNNRIAAGQNVMPRSIYMVCLYIWVTTRVVMADDVKTNAESRLSDFVVFKSLNMVNDGLNLPEETIKDLLYRVIEIIN